MDNSKVIPLVGGGAATLTNSVRAGAFTLTCLHQGTEVTDGDMIVIARQLQELGDSKGGQFRVATYINGVIDAITYLYCTLKVFDSLLLAGNDLPEYPVEFNYQDYTLS